MSFTKIDYAKNDALTAEQVNAIQDAILEHEKYLEVLNNIPRDENATSELLKISADKHNYYDITSGLSADDKTWGPLSTDFAITLQHNLSSAGLGTVQLDNLKNDITAGDQETLKAVTLRINRGNSSVVSPSQQTPIIKLCDGLIVYHKSSSRLTVYAVDTTQDDSISSPNESYHFWQDNTEVFITIVRGKINSNHYTAVYFDDDLFWEYDGSLYKQTDYQSATIDTGVAYLQSLYVNEWTSSDGFAKSDISGKVKNMVEKFKADRSVSETVNLSNFLRDLEYQIKEIRTILNS